MATNCFQEPVFDWITGTAVYLSIVMTHQTRELSNVIWFPIPLRIILVWKIEEHTWLGKCQTAQQREKRNRRKRANRARRDRTRPEWGVWERGSTARWRTRRIHAIAQAQGGRRGQEKRVPRCAQWPHLSEGRRRDGNQRRWRSGGGSDPARRWRSATVPGALKAGTELNWIELELIGISIGRFGIG